MKRCRFSLWQGKCGRAQLPTFLNARHDRTCSPSRNFSGHTPLNGLGGRAGLLLPGLPARPFRARPGTHWDGRWSGLFCSTRWLDRTWPHIDSAAELAQFRLCELSFEQPSPSLARPSLFGLSEITRPPHQLGAVRRRDARYSSRRGPLAAADSRPQA